MSAFLDQPWGLKGTVVNPWSPKGLKGTVVNPGSPKGLKGTVVNPGSPKGLKGTVVNPGSPKGLKGTVVNRECPFFNGRSLEITQLRLELKFTFHHAYVVYLFYSAL